MSTTTLRRMLGAALLGFALGGCSVSASIGVKTLDTAKLEDTISAEIAKEVNGTVDVSCPDGVEAQAGHTFECTATADDGSAGQVRVTQIDDLGNVEFALV